LTHPEEGWTVITVTYNSRATLERCWSGVDLASIRWIVVDNGSRDGSGQIAEDLGAEVISLDANIGFSRANNRGLREVRSKHTAFVNPDVVIRPADLPSLARLCSGDNALVAPQLINRDNSLQPNARGLPYLVDKFAHRGINLPGADLRRYVPSIETTSYAAWLTGAVIAGETAAFRTLGGWDERFFLYHEDSSLCLLAWEQDFKVILSADQQWVHEWKRDTKSLKWKPIIHEAISAWKFYRRYPMLLSPTMGDLTPGLLRASDLVGKPVQDNPRIEGHSEGTK
jgi:GT2 family glycosyltransferase